MSPLWLAALIAATPTPLAIPGGRFAPMIPNADYLRFVLSRPAWGRDRIAALFADDGYLAHWSGPLSLGARAPATSPVLRVSWFAADAYCRAQGGRLPTWQEWEYVSAASETAADARKDPAWPQRILGWYERREPLIPSVGLIERLKTLDASLDPTARAKVRYLLVSFDPDNDTPERLAALAELHHLDLTRWTLARTDPRSVRTLANVLAIKYRKSADGSFDHGSPVTLFGPDGAILVKVDDQSAPLSPVRDALAMLYQ